MSDVQLLLLAAGSSSRMKEPKQLMPWGTTTLIEHQIHNLLDTGKSVSVVIGAYQERIVPLIENLPINVIYNEGWQDGMGSSIAKGVKEVVAEHPAMDGLLISLIDQPLLTTTYFNKMLRAFKQVQKQIIVSKGEARWSGAPVIFDKTYFKELMQLKGDEGAKIITNSHKEMIVSVDAGSILTDVDTQQAYQKLLECHLNKK